MRYSKAVVKIASVLVVSVLALTMALPVLAYTFRASYVVTENGTASYTMLPIRQAVNNLWMSTHGFLQSNAMDSRIETLGGVVYPHMVTDNETFTALAISANTQTNLYYTTGSTNLSNMSIIPGYGGNLSVTDAPGIEFGSNFSLSATVYSTGNSTVFDKSGAFSLNETTLNSTTLNVTAGTGTIFPIIDSITGGVTASSTTHSLTLPSNIRKGELIIVFTAMPDSTANTTLPAGWNILYGGKYEDTILFSAANAWYYRAVGGESSTLNITTNVSTQVAYNAYLIQRAGNPTSSQAAFGTSTSPDSPNHAPGLGNYLWLAAFGGRANGGAGGINYPAGYSQGTANGVAPVGIEIASASLNSTAANENPGGFASADGFSFRWIAGTVAIPGMNTTISTTATRNSQNIYTANISSGNLTLYKNGVASASTNYTGIYILDNSSNITLLSGVPYATNITLSVNNTQVLWYSPNDMIHGTVLPNRASTSNNATINFGANPAGVAIAIGGMVSTAQPSVSTGVITTPSTDIMRPVDDVTDKTYDYAGVGPKLLNSPLRPLVTMVSDPTTLTEIQVWRWYAIGLTLIVIIGTARKVRGYYAITGVAAGAVIGACTYYTIFPWWGIFVMIAIIVAGILTQTELGTNRGGG